MSAHRTRAERDAIAASVQATPDRVVDTLHAFICHLHAWHDAFLRCRGWNLICGDDLRVSPTECNAGVLGAVKTTSHIWTSHVTHMNKSRHTYERVTSHMWMGPATPVNGSRHTMNEQQHTYEWVMSHILQAHWEDCKTPHVRVVQMVIQRYAWVMSHIHMHEKWVMSQRSSPVWTPPLKLHIYIYIYIQIYICHICENPSFWVATMNSILNLLSVAFRQRRLINTFAAISKSSESQAFFLQFHELKRAGSCLQHEPSCWFCTPVHETCVQTWTMHRSHAQVCLTAITRVKSKSQQSLRINMCTPTHKHTRVNSRASQFLSIESIRHTHTHTHIYTYIYIYIYTYHIYVCMFIQTRIYIYIHMYVGIQICIHACWFTDASFIRETSRFTSRPEARGSGVEAVFRFLGSGVDFF